MANRTVKDAKSVKGTNPQYLIEKIIRSRIYECRFWKEDCFALSAELLVDKAMELKYVGGVFGGNIKVTPFICLILKMLQIQPEKDIVVEFIRNEEFKYVRALGAVYMRITGTSIDSYKYLEPLYNDYRKLKFQNPEGRFEIIHMDELIDDLLHQERVCDVIMPRIQKRHVLEETNELEPRVSALEDDMDDDEIDLQLLEELRKSPSPVANVATSSATKEEKRRGSPDQQRRERRRSQSPSRKRRSRSPRDRHRRRESPDRTRHRRDERRHEHSSRHHESSSRHERGGDHKSSKGGGGGGGRKDHREHERSKRGADYR